MFHALRSRSRGQAALSLVFMIGGIALLVAITLALVAISFMNSTFAFQSANQALAAATSGVEDALLTFARNGTNFSSRSWNLPPNCSGNGCASVLMTQNGGVATIISTATVFSSQRKIQVVAALDQNTGQVSVLSWTVLTL